MRVVHALPLVAVLAVATDLAHAGWFEIRVDSDSANAEVGAHFGSDPQAQFGLGARGLYNGDRDTNLGILVTRFEAESDRVPGLSFTVGIDALAGVADDLDVGAAAIHIESDFGPSEWRGAFFGVGVAFAPEIFTWSDTETLAGWSARAGYRINAKAKIFAEYQEIRVDFVDVGRRTIDEGIKAGFGVRF